MKVLFIQTAEENYKSLLDLSSQTVIEYCINHKHVYQNFFGVVRGYHPWQATYNRIPLLKTLLDGGWTGWVCYLDADAYIADLNFDLRVYLRDKSNIAFIAATDRPGEPERPFWLVNAGVFLINLSHPFARNLIESWAERFNAIPDHQLMERSVWGGNNDQDMLQAALRDLPGAEAATLTLRGGDVFLNYGHGKFIRQVLRGGENMPARVNSLRAGVDHMALMREPIDNLREFVTACYRAILLREPDKGGLENAMNLMRQGLGYEQILRGVFGSKEFQGLHGRFIETYAKRTNVNGSNLTTLANRYGSDKGTLHGGPPHKYSYLYDLIFKDYAHRPINFLELGLARGGPEVGGPVDREVMSPSVQMWLDYFPLAHVYGFDISDFSHMKHPRFTFVRGDGGVPEDFERLVKTTDGFDIIIDDGSHASFHQQVAFRNLFPKLRSGGIYVIEDLHWQSPTYENNFGPLPKTRDFMIEFFENGVYLPNSLLSESFMAEVEESAFSFAWFPCFSGAESVAKLVVLRKK
jgi:hypothetical protein